MSDIPSFKAISDLALRLAGPSSPTASALGEVEHFRGLLRDYVGLLRREMARAFDFADRGLVCEATSVIEDFPNLVQQADKLMALPTSSSRVENRWREIAGSGEEIGDLPTEEEVQRLDAIHRHGIELARLIEPYREAVLRGVPLGVRIRLLKRIRAADPSNAIWLEQREALERARIAEMTALLDRPPEREALETALAELTKYEWVATVPRTLVERLHEHVRPLRTVEAGTRYGEIAAKVHAAAASMDRAALLALEAEWAVVQHETGRLPTPELEAEVKTAFEWLAKVTADERADAAWHERIAAFEAFLDQRPELPEVEAKLEEMLSSGERLPAQTITRVESMRRSHHRRRTRNRALVTLATLAALIGIVLGTRSVLAWRAETQDRKARATELARLLEVGKSGVARAHEVAESLRPARPGEAGVANLIDKTERLWLTREADLAAAEGVRAAAAAALAKADRQHPDRSTLLAQKGRVSEAAALLREYGEKDRAAAVASLETELLQVIDHLDEKQLARIARAKRDVLDFRDRFPPLADLPPASKIDRDRLGTYIDARTQLSQRLGEAKHDLLGAPGAVAEIDGLLAQVDAWGSEVSAHLGKLLEAEDAIAPSTLEGLSHSEEQFINHLSQTLATHGDMLSWMGKRDGIEQALGFANWWRSLQTWRGDLGDRVRHEIATGRLDVDEGARSVQAAADLAEFEGTYPGNPYQDALRDLAVGSRNAGVIGGLNRRELQLVMVEFLVFPLRSKPLEAKPEGLSVTSDAGTTFVFPDGAGLLPEGARVFVNERGVPVLVEAPGEEYRLATVKRTAVDDEEGLTLTMGAPFSLQLDTVTIAELGNRSFYRRSGDNIRETNILHLAVMERRQLALPEFKRESAHPYLALNSVDAPPSPDKPVFGVGPDDAPSKWKAQPVECLAVSNWIATIEGLSDASGSNATVGAIELIDKLLQDEKSDPILRLQLIKYLVDRLVAAQAVPREMHELLQVWLRECSNQFGAALSDECDWVAIVHQPNQVDTQRIRGLARQALGRLPLLNRLLETTRATLQKRADAIRRYRPVGVLIPTEHADRRQIRPGTKLTAVQVLVRKAERSEFVELPLDRDGVVDVTGLALPLGPLLCYEPW